MLSPVVIEYIPPTSSLASSWSEVTMAALSGRTVTRADVYWGQYFGTAAGSSWVRAWIRRQPH